MLSLKPTAVVSETHTNGMEWNVRTYAHSSKMHSPMTV